MALPALDAIARAYPHATIEVYVGRHSRAVFEPLGSVVDVKQCPDTLNWNTALQLTRTLRQRNYAVVFSLDRSRMLSVAARLGSRGPAHWVLSRLPEDRHESEVYLDVVRAAGIAATLKNPSLPVRTASDRTIPCPYAVLHPGGGSNPGSSMPSKRWSEENWITLASSLAERGLHPVITGSTSEAVVARRIASVCATNTTVVAGNLTLAETFDVVGSAALFVGPDTGLTHVAAALDIPCVAIFGPTNPQRYRPLGRSVAVCAAPGSTGVPDRDLRQPAEVPPDASIELVRVADVLAACDRLLVR